jgi:hypothetical protein
LTWSRVVGCILVAMGILGIFTVADDLRHVGEILGVSSVLVIGLLLVAASWTSSIKLRVGCYVLSAALALGALAGAVTDHVAFGVGGGLAIGGVVAAVLVRLHETRSSHRGI